MLTAAAAFAGRLLGGLSWKWLLAAALAAAGAGLWIHVKTIEADRLAAEKALMARDLASAVDAAEMNAAAMRRLRAQAARDLAAVTAERDAHAARLARLNLIGRKIDDAPESDDGPVAPVLGAALDGLRRELAAPGRDED